MKMMKLFVLGLVLCLPIGGITQTLEIEKNEMNKAFMATAQSQQMKDKIIEWSVFLKTNSYPNMPYDKDSKTINYQYIIDCKEMPIKNIKNRVKEWIALNFGHYDAVVHYENESKIIVKGSFNVYYEEKVPFFFFKLSFPVTVPVNSMYVFTFKEGLLKIDVTNTESGTNFISVQENSMKFMTNNQFFPISKWDSKYWRGFFAILNQSDFQWKSTFLNIEKYILSEKEDYNFTK